MINRLKRRFIILAMTALAVLLAVIVAAMNTVNYKTVVSDADNRIEVLSQNSEMLLDDPGAISAPGDGMQAPGIGSEDMIDGSRDEFFGSRGEGGPSMSRDEAEESRFFTVTLDESGSIKESNTSRISAVDSDEAAEYAAQAAAAGKDKGFIGDFRFSVSDDDGSTRIIFLDCGRILGSYRDFLRYSVMMSLLGLLIMFAFITYFAGRIVKPVAESYEKQKRFITDAGHEIKTPLAIIKANIDLMDMELGSGDEKDELRESLDDIDVQVDRLTGLTNDLVYLSRMEEGGSSPVMTEVVLSDIVSGTVSGFEPLAAEKGSLISINIEPMITVRGSSKDLEKLVSILMENAVKYSLSPCAAECGDGSGGMAAPPEIRVSLRKEGRSAVLEVVNDTEAELTNESLSHVFERFYRTDSSRNSETGGHGIGLSMANAIVSAHGGKISAKTTNGHSFVITAALPLN